MTHDPHWGGTIRKLWSTEGPKLRDHLLRLDPSNRRMRFAHAVSDQFITDYASRLPDMAASSTLISSRPGPRVANCGASTSLGPGSSCPPPSVPRSRAR